MSCYSTPRSHFEPNRKKKFDSLLIGSILRPLAQRSLHCIGFRSRRPTSIPFLSAHYRAARLAWAREYNDWRVVGWKRVARSDE
ncbi:hypothetical protein TNCV_227201 [Trichonephila clavipes]|nr:hypothetical protein TNCV_227201 [Trichonephila clavipes]